MSLIRTNYVPERRIREHAQSVLAAGQKHHNSSQLASACNMVTNKDLKRQVKHKTPIEISTVLMSLQSL